MPTVIDWEKLDDALAAGMAAMTFDFWMEMGDYQWGLSYAPAWDAYRRLEQAGVFHMLTLRRDGALAGWLSLTVTPHLHHASMPHVTIDSLYVRPGMRACAALLVRALERRVWEIVPPQPVRIMHGLPAAHPFNYVLDRMGFPAIEIVHAKVVQPPPDAVMQERR